MADHVAPPRPDGFVPGPEPAPLVAILPLLRVGAGSASTFHVAVTNTADEARELLVLAVGVDQAWLPGPVRTRVLAPGETEQVALRIAPTAGTLPAEYPLAVTVQSVVPATGRASAAATGLGETSVVVNPRAQLSIDANPEQARFVRGQRMRLTLRNTGATPATVQLEATSTKGLLVRLGKREVTVPPGGEERVRGRFVATRPRRIGGSITHSWNVVASSPEIVRQVRGTAQQRALFGNALMKAVVVLAVVAVWIAAVLVLVPQVGERFGNEEASETAGGAGDGGSDDGGAGEDGGAGGAGGAAGGKVKVTQAKSTASPAGVQVNGTVAADQPDGVTVSLKGISLVDEEAQSAENFDEVAAVAQLSASGKTSPASFLLSLPREPGDKKKRPACSAVAQCTAVTTEDGTWSIPDVAAPGYYLVSFSKPGYDSQRFVIDAATFDPTEPLEIEMLPGDGALSGVVRGPNGKPLGGATVTISDGTTTITTSSASRGQVGRWEVSGLATPASYLVEASSFGLGTESQLVDLGPAESGTANMRLQPGIAVLRGEIQGKISGGRTAGLGGVTVSVSDDEGNVRSASTVTTGKFAGTFQLPGLPSPGDYTVSMSAPGYQTETRNLTLRDGQGARRLDAFLVSAFGVVSGTVRDRNDDPVEGAGLTLTDGTRTYKTTSISRTEATGRTQRGGFEFTGVTPGVYQLTTEYFGFTSSVLTLEVTAGKTTAAWPRLIRVPGGVIPRESSITGSVVEAGTGDLVECPEIPPATPGDPVTFEPCLNAVVTDSDGDEVENGSGDAIGTTEFTPDAEYTLPDDGQPVGLVPGLYTVTVSAPHYEAAKTRVQVGFKDNAVADTIHLSPAPVITGFISAVAGTPAGPVCVWAVPDGVPAPTTRCSDPAPTACTPNSATFDPTDTTPRAQCAWVNGLGSYSIEVPKRGEYTLLVQPSDDEYPAPPDVRINAPAGSTVGHNVQLNRLGRITLTALEAGAGGALVASEGASITLDGLTGAATGYSETRTSPAGGETLFTSLPEGVYRVSGSKALLASDPFLVFVGSNQDDERIVALVRRVAALVGKVTWNRGGAVPIDGATVTVTGPVGYSNTSPYNGSTTLTTDADDGCFVITRTSTTTAPAPGLPGCTDTYASPAWQRIDFLSSTASEVRINKAGFDQLVLRNHDLLEGAVNGFTLEPSAVPFVGDTGTTRIVADGTTPDFSNATFRVDSTTTSASTISMKADAGGDLTWTDTRYGSVDLIRPGNYTVTATLAGYTSSPVSITCEVAAASCSTTDQLRLRQLGSLTVNAVDSGGAAVDNVVTTLRKGGTVVGQKDSPNDGNSVSFPDLLPGATDYALRVQAAGYDFDAGSLSCTPAGGTTSTSLTIEAGTVTTCNLTLTRLGTFTGTLNGVLADSPASSPVRQLAGATVQATPCTATATASSVTYCTAVNASRRLTTSSDAGGGYSLTGTNSIEGIDTGYWLLTTVLPGWSQPPAAASGALQGTLVNVTTGGNLPRDLSMFVNRVNFTTRVIDQGGTRVSDATVKLLQGATEVATGTLTGSGTTAQFDFANVLPGLYTLEISGSGLVKTTVQVEIQVGVANQSFQAFVSRATNSVSGHVRGGDRPGGLSSVDVKMYKCADTGTTCQSTVANGTDGAALDTDTDGAGNFQLRTVPNGRFLIKFTKTGYTSVDSAIITFDHTQAAPSLTVDMPVSQRLLNVTIDPTTNSEDLTGATLTLTPTGTTENTALPPATVTTRSASFGQVRFGCWNIAMTLPADHYGAITYPAATTNAAMSCTGNVIVPPTASSSPLNVEIDLVETELQISVSATALSGHAAPTTANVEVRGPDDVDFPTFAVGSGTRSIWVSPGSYDVTAEAPAGFSSEFWPSDAENAINVTTTNGPRTAALALAERTGSVGVTVTGIAASPTRWVRITVAAGSGQTAPVPAAHASGVVVTSNAVQTFNLPSGNWVFTGTYVTGASSTTQVAGSTVDTEIRNMNEHVETGNVTLAPTYPPPPPGP